MDKPKKVLPKLKEELIVLTETREQALFLEVYRNYLQQQGYSIRKMQLLSFGELVRMEKCLQLLPKMEGFGQVKKLVLIANAGASWRETMWKLDSVLSHNTFAEELVPRYYLWPGKKGHYWQKGFFEDLLWETLRERSAEACHYILLRNITEDFLLSVRNSRLEECPLLNESRHKLYAYLAATSRYVGMNLAEAAQAGAFELGSPVWDKLQEFLQEL